MSPSAGGQYQWVSEFAPPSMQRFLSYVSGWLAALGWQAFIAVSAYQSGSLILTMASMQNPSYSLLFGKLETWSHKSAGANSNAVTGS